MLKRSPSQHAAQPSPDPGANSGRPGGSGARRMGEIAAYLGVQASWFSAFGVLMVLQPYLASNVLGASSLELGLAQAALTAPFLFLLLPGGLLAERIDGRAILFTAHMAAAAGAASLAAAIWLDRLSLPLVAIYALVMGSIGASSMPGREALAAQVAAGSQEGAPGSGVSIQRVINLALLTQFIAQVAGTAAAGAAERTGPALVLAAQSAVLLAGALTALRLRPRAPRRVKHTPGLPGHEVLEAWRVVQARPVLLSMVGAGVALGVFVVGAGFLVILPQLNADVYGQGSAGMSAIWIAFMGGAVAATVAIAARRSVERNGRALIVGLLFGAASLAALSIEPPFRILLGLAFCWGVSAGIAMTMSRSILQENTPDSYLPRVIAIYNIGNLGGGAIGALLAGAALNYLGLGAAKLIPAIGVGGVALWLIAGGQLWRLRRRDLGEPAAAAEGAP